LNGHAVVDCPPESIQYFTTGLDAYNADNFSGALTSLTRASDACETYQTSFYLGRATQRLGRGLPDTEGKDNFDRALAAFNKAQQLANDSDEQALSIARYAEVLVWKGTRVEALPLLKVANRLHSSPPSWITALTIELDKSLRETTANKDFFLRSSGLSTASSHMALLTVSDIQVKPYPGKHLDTQDEVNHEIEKKLKLSVDVRINFKTDSVEMDHFSRTNVIAMADALMDQAFQSKTIWLVGHTDIRGSEAYNKVLSERRAHAIYKTVVALYPDLHSRLKTRGAGELEPLYKGNSDDVHMLNRRLEVVID